MARRLNFAWRLFATGFCFSAFGIGGMFMGYLILPLIHLLSRNRRIANRRCQYLVHLSFRLFIGVMRGLRVLSYEMVGREQLHQSDSKLIVSNHPSLIDIVFIVSLLPQAVCAVKKAAWSNPFMAGVMWATGYVPNDEPMRFIDDCVENVQDGQRLVIFPEGTRTVPGQPMKLRRGAATIIAKSAQSFIPIHITSDPTTLTKAEKWYQIPHRKVHFKIVIGGSYDPRSMLVGETSLVRTNRKVNEVLKTLLSGGIEQHGHVG